MVRLKKKNEKKNEKKKETKEGLAILKDEALLWAPLTKYLGQGK